jgi:alkyl hydroperoxide reductase subunit AhpF
MTTIAEKDRPTVRDVLARELVDEVELLLFTRARSPLYAPGQQDSHTCEETRELLEELASLSDLLHLTTFDVGADPAAATRFNVTAVPTVMIRRRIPAESAPAAQTVTASSDGALDTTASSAAELDVNVRFVGMPGGYEFSTLLADIVDVSKHRTDLSEAAREVVRAIETPVHFQVFVTPSCPYCPRAARVAHQMAMENPLIVADVIEANEFQYLSERYRVRSVPKTVINGRIEFVGPLPEAKVLEALQQAIGGEGRA